MVLSKRFKICSALYLGLNLAVCADDINAYREAAKSDHNPASHSYMTQFPRTVLGKEAIDAGPLGTLVVMTGISTMLLSLPGFYTGEFVGKNAYKPAP